MRVYISATVGSADTFFFDVDEKTTIRELKRRYLRKAEKPDDEDLDDIFLEKNGIKLDADDKTLASYAIDDGSILLLGYRSFDGRNPRFGTHFVDVTKEAGLKRIDWGKTAPDWLIAYPGLCLEGICKNKACDAVGKKVIMSMGYREFDIVKDTSKKTTVCPMCKSFVNPTTCAFNRCWWRYEGIKQVDESEAPEDVPPSSWRHADNAYHYFDETESGIIQWRCLKLTARKDKPTK